MQDNLPCKKITLDKPEGRRRVGRPNLRWMDGWSDEGCREVGSQKLGDQGQGQRWLEAITRIGQDPAWVVAPGWMDGISPTILLLQLCPVSTYISPPYCSEVCHERRFLKMSTWCEKGSLLDVMDHRYFRAHYSIGYHIWDMAGNRFISTL
jgi:hypothetical protein